MSKVPISTSFPCPCGGSYAKVITSRGTASGFAYRVRECACGARIRTHETSRGRIGYDPLVDAFERFLERADDHRIMETPNSGE